MEKLKKISHREILDELRELKGKDRNKSGKDNFYLPDGFKVAEVGDTSRIPLTWNSRNELKLFLFGKKFYDMTA